MKLSEIASAICAHLVRFAANKKLAVSQNTDGPKVQVFSSPTAWSAGARVGIRYVSYQRNHFLSKTDAAAYLAWLDAGNVGRHWDAQKEQAIREAAK